MVDGITVEKQNTTKLIPENTFKQHQALSKLLTKVSLNKVQVLYGGTGKWFTAQLISPACSTDACLYAVNEGMTLS